MDPHYDPALLPHRPRNHMPKTNYNTITTVNSEPASAESKSIDGEQFDGTAKLAKEGAIILIPNPSQDPRGKQPIYYQRPRKSHANSCCRIADPLNLPVWHKNFIMFILTLCTSTQTAPLSHEYSPRTDSVSGLTVVAGLGALLVYFIPEYHKAGKSTAQISALLTYPNLFLGVGNLFSMPLVLAVGRRPVFLASNLLLFFSCILCATNKNFEWHLAARCLAALSGAQCEALVPLIIQVSSAFSFFSIRTNPTP